MGGPFLLLDLLSSQDFFDFDHTHPMYSEKNKHLSIPFRYLSLHLGYTPYTPLLFVLHIGMFYSKLESETNYPLRHF